jgi:hypothetical protein
MEFNKAHIGNLKLALWQVNSIDVYFLKAEIASKAFIQRLLRTYEKN